MVVLTLRLGFFVESELRSSEYYQVPIACAFACATSVANALGLAATGLLLGLAVGSRTHAGIRRWWPIGELRVARHLSFPESGGAE